jgi:hypothetical protein
MNLLPRVLACVIAAALAISSFDSGTKRAGAGPSVPAAVEAKAPGKPCPATLIDASKYADLQAALDAVPEAGGLVKLPPGQFRITKPLVLSRGNTRVEGAGNATQIINCNDKGEPAFVVRGPSKKTRLWRVQVANFQICGDPQAINNKSTAPKGGDGLVFESIDELLVHNMTVDHHGGHGINLIHCLEDPRIADSIITYNMKAGLNILGGHDIVVNANHFEENDNAVRCIDSFNLTMNGNNLDDHRKDGVIIENTYGSVLSGNMIEECEGIAVILDRDCYGITISANVIAHNAGGGVDLRDAWGCTVSANTFTIDNHFGLRIGPEAGRIVVTGNSFSNSYVGGKQKFDGPAGGIVLQETADNVISGNLFSGLIGQAVMATGSCQRLAITGNLTVDLNRKSKDRRPALDVGQAPKSLIGNNLLDDSAANPAK